MAAVIGFAACKTNDKKVTDHSALTSEQKEKALMDTANFTRIEWLDGNSRDLGKLKKDQSVEVTFRFKNSGDKNLVIENVSASCGCTIPEKPERPFAPGEEGIIKAKFNGSGQGTITKQITVIANTTPQKDHSLTFSGEIKE